jgi:hypothetical protein
MGQGGSLANLDGIAIAAALSAPPSCACYATRVTPDAAATEAPGRSGPTRRVGVRATSLRAWAPRLRVLLVALGVASLVLATRGGSGVRAKTLEGSLARHVAHRGMAVDPAEVAWLAPNPNWLGTRPALFVARAGTQWEDVYYADVRVTDDGGVVDAYWVTNVTRSSSAREGRLVRTGRYVAYGVLVGDAYEAVVVLDSRGESAALTRGWPWRARWQNAISNIQECGRAAGFGRTRYVLDPPARDLRLRTRAGHIEVELDGTRLRLDPRQPASAPERLRAEAATKGEPGTITWLVDTVRNVSWIGPRPIEWLEHVVFGVTDRVERAYHTVAGADTETQAREAREALAAPEVTDAHAAVAQAVRDPEIGLPPAALSPVLSDPMRGEGEWIPVVDSGFVNAYPGAPTAFWQTFLRVDPTRSFERVYVTLWDPRQVQLHVAMGTREPESATGETGKGLIPREPDLLGDLVAGFNGAFQALHGEFGAMADGRVYLPPKPFAATVVVHADGRVALGTWPGPGRRAWDEEMATRQIPIDVVSLRQNLTSVVEDGEYNPWKRWYWGAAPVAADEQTYIGRSGLCLTEDGFMAFLWGETMGPDELGKAMLVMRCARGMHLDMNTKHTGFEFYRPFGGGQAPPALGRDLAASEFEGPMLDAPGWVFRARLAVATMAPIRFPRYLGRDPRDFFYLTRKRVLPGPPVVHAGATYPFTTDGLPRVPWPRAFARARLEAPGAWLVRIDARRVPPPALAPDQAGEPVAWLTGGRALARPPASPDEEALYAVRAHGRTRFAVGRAPRKATVLLSGVAFASAAASTAALGVDAEGFVLYAEADTAEALRHALDAAGVARALALPEGVRLAFATDGTTVAVDGRTPRSLTVDTALPWVPDARPAAEVLHAEIDPMPYPKWGWLQDQRVRYFPQNPPRFPAPDAVR